MAVQIFWSIIAGFLLGVFFRSLIPLGLTFAGFLVLLGICLLLFALIERSKSQVKMLAVVALLSCAFGITRMHMSITPNDLTLDTYVGKKVVITGVVQDEPDVRESSVRIPIFLLSVASSSVSNAGVLVIAPLHTEVAYGDTIRVEGKLRIPEHFETGKGRTFDYPGYLAKDGIRYQISFATIKRLDENGGNFIKAWAIRIKQKYLDGLALALSEPQAGLAGGITVGDKRGLGEELSETFRTVGLTHIVVLSGYNIMVVVDALMHLLSRAPQILRFSSGVFVAIFFAAITGFASASSRAAAMAVIAIVGKATRRTYFASRALALVAFVMVAWNPYVLVFDPGFQLSVLATIGLIVFSPFFESWLKWIPSKFALREIASATLGTQLAVLPLLLYQNGQMSLFALPANLLALIVIPWAMLLSAVASISGLISGIAAPIFGIPAYALLSYVIYVAKTFAALPFSTFGIPAFNAWWLVLVYVLLFIPVLRKKIGRQT